MQFIKTLEYSDENSTQRRFLLHGDKYDLGYDLPGPKEKLIVAPGTIGRIETGIKIKFPLFGKLRRAICRIILGMDIVGIGGIVFPRGRTRLLIGSGVIDAGYRGEIIVRAVNTTSQDIVIQEYESIAQLIPMLVINMNPKHGTVDINTKRGSSGGIWHTGLE